MNLKIVKILREGKKTCSHSWRIGTEWQMGVKHCFVRICGRCNRVEECREFGKVQKNKKLHFSTSEVAGMLGISKKWLYILEQTKKIPQAKRDSNNFRFYTKSDIERIKKIRGRRK